MPSPSASCDCSGLQQFTFGCTNPTWCMQDEGVESQRSRLNRFEKLALEVSKLYSWVILGLNADPGN